MGSTSGKKLNENKHEIDQFRFPAGCPTLQPHIDFMKQLRVGVLETDQFPATLTLSSVCFGLVGVSEFIGHYSPSRIERAPTPTISWPFWPIYGCRDIRGLITRQPPCTRTCARRCGLLTSPLSKRSRIPVRDPEVQRPSRRATPQHHWRSPHAARHLSSGHAP
jgi:hypothetical protein